MDSLNSFRQERFYADPDEMPPLMYVSDEAVGRRHVPITGVPLEGGPYAIRYKELALFCHLH